MSVKLRFKRLGRKNRPFYRLVAIDSRKRRDGREIEKLGWFNPSSVDETFKFNENRVKNSNQNFKSKYTFKGYYEYENYKYIKSLVGDSRTISVGLDPLVAVMNDIKVIDGYHTLYPLSYKLKFRKVIEEQLQASEKTRQYYDLWGSRVYTFVNDSELIKTNFLEANLLGAEYVISKYSISSMILVPICEKCNNSSELFLYKIMI